MFQNKIIILFLGILLIMWIITGCGTSKTPVDQVSLQLNWYHAAEFIGYYMADSKGYYRDSNINPKIIEGGPGIAARDYILDGRADFAIASFR